MAPIKPKIATKPPTRTSNKLASTTSTLREIKGKRKADTSPTKEKSLKRFALGDLPNVNNRIKSTRTNVLKKVKVQTKVLPTVKSVTIRNVPKENVVPRQTGGMQLRPSLRTAVPKKVAQKLEPVSEHVENKMKTRRSSMINKTGESLYLTATDT